MPAHPGPLPTTLRSLAAAYGVLTTYVEHGGRRRHAGADELVAVLEALGAHDAGADPQGALAARRAGAAARTLSPVTVLEPAGRTVPVAVSARDGLIECALRLEGGDVLEWSAPVDELVRLPGHGVGRGRRRVALELPTRLDPGYHQLTVITPRAQEHGWLFVRPDDGARGRFDDAWRAAGISAPLFTLHSDRSWGCGDLTDLDALGEFASRQGVSVLATLPLLAGQGPTHFEPSPYLPLSRSFWHERWIDVDVIPGLAHVPGAAERARTLAAGLRDAAAASHPVVPGAASLAAKWEVLRALADGLGAPGRPSAEGLEAFLVERPAVADYARFRAAGARFGDDWRTWPHSLRDGTITDGDVDLAEALFHSFVQWVAHEQLTGVAQRFERRGQVLSLDLPLGVHPEGYDVWRSPNQFVDGVSVGAPPDRFFPRGQVWGFPPPRYDAVRDDGHQGFRAALSHHLNVARMLRIDHVMGLQRLYLVPEGAAASQGVYVRAPLEELLAIIAIEAQRHRATIVGEDLGTVDAAVRDAMRRDGIRRTFAVELSIRHTGVAPFAAPPPGSVASFATHDLPTFAGWWLGRDVDERVALGQVDAATGTSMRAARRRERRRLAALLVPPPVGPGVAGVDVGVLDASMAVLASSDAALVVAQLDDLLGELDAVNLPGTSSERVNWQRRTRLAVNELDVDADVGRRLAVLGSRTAGGAVQGELDGRHVVTVGGVTRFGELDDHLFATGGHARLYDKLGAHRMAVNGVDGTYFAVWAPNAAWVEVVGDFNGWEGRHHPLASRGPSGIWEGFIPGVGTGERYKYRLASSVGGGPLDKADPFARRAELAPATASITTEHGHAWGDAEWLDSRAARQGLGMPISVYEVHLGSWRRVPEEGARTLTYREVAPLLIDHVRRHHFTHVELLPMMEHPYFGSWGYHVTGFFAPTSRYGAPDDFAALVDELHGAGIGVILDWVPAHFPADAFALAGFDGTHLFEHADPRQGVHPDWQSLIFNYGRPEVRSFLLSAACYWLDRYHIDGLRFDAVASMLYLDYSRGPGEWVPNRLGGNQNLEAVEFLSTCNTEIHRAHPGVLTFAEESTSWPGVTAPTEDGGLGFDYKWDLGWMHDTLDYLSRDPLHRSWHHDQLTFRTMYATSEQFILPLSHDEVVHGKGSLLGRMPGDEWQRFANLRLLLGFQLAQPGKKLLFMGGEFGQRGEWAHDASLDWHLLERPEHAGVAAFVARINEIYRDSTALHADDRDDRGFALIDGDDRSQSVLCVERFDGHGACLVVVLNATPNPRHDYLVGMPDGGTWELVVSSDDVAWGGSGHEVLEAVEAEPTAWHGRPHRAALTLPPLGFVIYSLRAGADDQQSGGTGPLGSSGHERARPPVEGVQP